MATIEEHKRAITRALKANGKYSKSLDMQILSLASALRNLDMANVQIDGLTETTVWEKTRYGEKLAPHPVFKIAKDAQELITRQMKILGLTVDDLADSFYLNKYYLMKLFKDRYGMTINAYLNQARVTWVKQQLRFTDKTVETLAAELQIEPAYLSRLFKKVEGISPTSFRKSWRGK